MPHRAPFARPVESPPRQRQQGAIHPPRAQALTVTLVALSLALGAVLPQPAWAQNAAPRLRKPVVVDFVNAEIESVARAFSSMMGRPIMVDPRVKGNITVYSDQPQSVARAYTTFLSSLRGLGFSMVESEGILRVVPEADGKLQSGTVSVGTATAQGDQITTQIFPLRFENSNNLVTLLRPLISANNTINATPGSNALVITDYASNLSRLSKIITALDQPSGTGVEIVPLRNAVAADLAPLVLRLLESSAASAVPGAPPTSGAAFTVIPEPRSNGLVVRAANAARLAEVRAAIAQLDKPSTLIGPGGGMWVVHLKNADAERLATVVRAAFGAVGSGISGASAGAAATAGAASPAAAPAPGAQGNATRALSASAQPSTGGFIQADPSTNSLVITAPEPLYKQIRQLIDKLDTRRAQVYIESMIVEVSPSDSADFGFQWQGLLGKSGDKAGLVTGTNFGSSGRPSIIDINTSAAKGEINLGSGLNIGLLGKINGVTSLAAIARLLQSQSETNIVSTPNMMTLDNEEAKIVVGENVPFITGQFTGAGGGGNAAGANPFQTIERKDVGITLRIKPQVGEGGAVRMTIFQEQSSVKETTAAGTSNAGPSTTKRSIENTVVVDDGAILVLGGLIEDRFVTTRSKVPLLGDLPLLGALFRSESRERRRTNLMVFLRPVVLRDAASSNSLSLDRYDLIRGEQKAAQPERSFVMPINESPVLPPMRPLQDGTQSSAPPALVVNRNPRLPQAGDGAMQLEDPSRAGYR